MINKSNITFALATCQFVEKGRRTKGGNEDRFTISHKREALVVAVRESKRNPAQAINRAVLEYAR